MNCAIMRTCKEENTMYGFIMTIIVTVTVFVIFGRDEEGRTRFERRKIRKMQQASHQETRKEQGLKTEGRAA